MRSLSSSAILATGTNCVSLEVLVTERINCIERSSLKISVSITNGSDFAVSARGGFSDRNLTIKPEQLSSGTYDCIVSITDDIIVAERTRHVCNIPQAEGKPFELYDMFLTIVMCFSRNFHASSINSCRC